MYATLRCPHCGGQMNTLGPGPDRRSQRYMCLGCTGPLQVKELWQGQIARLGAHDFGFLVIDAMPFLGTLYFRLADVAGEGQPRIGDRVLALVEQGPRGQFARAVYPMPDAPQPRPDRRWRDRPAATHGARRWGEVYVLKAPDWGFLRDLETGEELFVHASNCRGPVLRVGQRVVYTPSRSPRGPQALDVAAA